MTHSKCEDLNSTTFHPDILNKAKIARFVGGWCRVLPVVVFLVIYFVLPNWCNPFCVDCFTSTPHLLYVSVCDPRTQGSLGFTSHRVT